MGIFSKKISEEVEQQAARDLVKQTPIRDVNDERIASAVEVITSHVMIADESNIIVAINAATLKMMQKAESDIQKALPHFSANNLIGASIDTFHQNPAHQKSMLKNLQTTHFGQITVGVRTFDLIANPIFDQESTRIGTVVEWLDITERLAEEELERQRAEEDKVELAANSRVRSALDVVTSNVMMADENNNIVYANEAVLDMLRSAEADIKKTLPNFSVKTVMGSNIDIFHRNPAHQIKMLAALSTTYKTEIQVGVRTFALVANPVFDEAGGRLGTVVEWNDRTAELAFEETVNNAIEAAVQGNIEARLEVGDTKGFIAKVASGINDLLEIFENVIADTSNSINALSNGQLDQKITTEYHGSFDVLKQNINNTIDKLVEVVTEIKSTAISVKDGSNEISSGNTNLSQRTEEQAASLEETSAAMEEITTTVQQTASNAQQANTLAQEAKGSAENGGSVVKSAVSAMQAISESSDQIADIITVIDEIAFQTNLLALNAAVEAARAGDQGKGFAVVADEVRSLAGRSAKAAKEIKKLIKDSGEKVKEGSELVNRSGETLDEIVTSIKKVNDIVAEISTASEEQSTGLAEINNAVSEMDEMTQQNAALVEEAAAAAEALGNQAVILDELISFFNTGAEAVDTVRSVATRTAPVSPPARKKAVAPKPKAEKAGKDSEDWSEF